MNFKLKKGDCEVTITMDCEGENKPAIRPENLEKIDVSNPENPFEEVALLHDYAMKRIFLLPKLRTFNEKEVLDQLSDIVEKYPFKSEFFKHIKKFDLHEAMDEIRENFNKPFDVSFLYPPTPEQEAHIPPFLRDVVCWLFKLVDGFDRSNDLITDRIKEIISFERDIMKSKKLDSETRDAALIATAIVRNSSVTYMEYFNRLDGLNPNGTGEGVIHAKQNGCCKKVARVAIADCIGALAGIGGGPGGIITGAVVGSGQQVIKEI